MTKFNASSRKKYKFKLKNDQTGRQIFQFFGYQDFAQKCLVFEKAFSYYRIAASLINQYMVRALLTSIYSNNPG